MKSDSGPVESRRGRDDSRRDHLAAARPQRIGCRQEGCTRRHHVVDEEEPAPRDRHANGEHVGKIDSALLEREGLLRGMRASGREDARAI